MTFLVCWLSRFVCFCRPSYQIHVMHINADSNNALSHATHKPWESTLLRSCSDFQSDIIIGFVRRLSTGLVERHTVYVCMHYICSWVCVIMLNENKLNIDTAICMYLCTIDWKPGLPTRTAKTES